MIAFCSSSFLCLLRESGSVYGFLHIHFFYKHRGIPVKKYSVKLSDYMTKHREKWIYAFLKSIEI